MEVREFVQSHHSFADSGEVDLAVAVADSMVAVVVDVVVVAAGTHAHFDIDGLTEQGFGMSLAEVV
jgi:hypothetical protein